MRPLLIAEKRPALEDADDIQGIVRFGHGRLSEAVFLLARIRDVEAAREWLREARVTSAETLASPPDTALQLAFTALGLEALALPPDILACFALEFLTGMSGEEGRSRRLGDVNANAPVHWQWGGSAAEAPHLLIMLYARSGGLEVFRRELQDELFERAFEVFHELPTHDVGDIEHFGFADGISQPQLDWRREIERGGEDILAFDNRITAGEVLLGYPNEYGFYSERPLLDPMLDAGSRILPVAEDVPEHYDLGRNGSYLVFRQLEQDVHAFWSYVDWAAGGIEDERLTLAAKMVGRWRDGTPLVEASDEPIAGIRADDETNRFTYADDARGHGCPLGAHVRRANPRTADLPGGSDQGLVKRLMRIAGFGRETFREDLIASTRFHRLLRRGREYGTLVEPEAALRGEGREDGPRGLHFICLCANIARQFEFVQTAWMANAKFDGLAEERDPLMGTRQPPMRGCAEADQFSIQREDAPARHLKGLPQFVTVRGGAYFFLPGLRALRWIAGEGRTFGDHPAQGDGP